jgi:hypothetical protein
LACWKQELEAKANLLRLKQAIPPTDDERAKVDDGLEALDKLCAQLADVPTPAGPTPHELAHPSRAAPPVLPANGRPLASAGLARHSEPPEA